MNRLEKKPVSRRAPQEFDCPIEGEVDWVEVAAGLWPETKAVQLIMHAAQCSHCGALLRASISVNDEPTPQEERMLARLKTPQRPPIPGTKRPVLLHRSTTSWPRQLVGWKMLAIATIVLVAIGTLTMRRSSWSTPLSGSGFAELAVANYRRHVTGNLPLDVLTDSSQKINEWLDSKSAFVATLPTLPATPGGQLPYIIEGARLLQIGGKTAAYIAYQMQARPVGLMITPVAVAVASGGVTAEFGRVTFHYHTVAGYRVVTWSAHGLTYALVSQEGNGTQGSCMVCHSAMGDRDLTHTPTPLRAPRTLGAIPSQEFPTRDLFLFAWRSDLGLVGRLHTPLPRKQTWLSPRHV